MLVRYIVSILAVLFTWTVPCASNENWQWQFGQGYLAYFGTNLSASDDVDSYDLRISSHQHWYVGTYKENNTDGWTGETGFYSTDIRAPLPPLIGDSKTWVFYMWSDPSHLSHLELGWGYSHQTVPAFDKMEYRLTYVQAPEGITEGSVPVGTSILLNDYRQGSWSFPVFRTENGLEGYKFEFTATVIPEPGSLVVLAGGLAGMAGCVLRRRRR